MSTPSPNALSLQDLTGRTDIERLVNAFYERVQEDEMLGFIFNDIARIDWAEHLPKM
jgi:hemoglobin